MDMNIFSDYLDINETLGYLNEPIFTMEDYKCLTRCGSPYMDFEFLYNVAWI